jgi:hypothetical protein
MYKFCTLLTVIGISFGMSVSADPYYGTGYYPTYNCDPQGYQQPCAADCYPCDPCSLTAPICGTDCGLSVCSIAAAIAAVVGVAAIILSSPNASHTHSPNL